MKHKEEIHKLKYKLQRASREQMQIERKHSEAERSRSNAEKYVEQALMANEMLVERIDHKNTKILKLRKKIRNISNESRGGVDSHRGSSRGSSLKQKGVHKKEGLIDLRSRNTSNSGNMRLTDSHEVYKKAG